MGLDEWQVQNTLWVFFVMIILLREYYCVCARLTLFVRNIHFNSNVQLKRFLITRLAPRKLFFFFLMSEHFRFAAIIQPWWLSRNTDHSKLGWSTVLPSSMKRRVLLQNVDLFSLSSPCNKIIPAYEQPLHRKLGVVFNFTPLITMVHYAMQLFLLDWLSAVHYILCLHCLNSPIPKNNQYKPIHVLNSNTNNLAKKTITLLFNCQKANRKQRLH